MDEGRVILCGVAIFIVVISYFSIKSELPGVIALLKLPALAQKPAFQDGSTRTLQAQIDGKEKELKVTTLDDLLTKMMSTKKKGILYLDEDRKGGRNIEMELTSDDEDDYMRLKLLHGEETLRDQQFNLDKDISGPFHFISEALRDV